MDAIIVTKGLTKTFRLAIPQEGVDWTQDWRKRFKQLFQRPQPKVVVDSVNLEVIRGEFLGLLGPNGAGKTTLIKMLTCLLYPDRGDAQILGYDIRKNRKEIKASLSLVRSAGWLGTIFSLTVWENLAFYARLSGLSQKVAHQRIETALDLLNLREKAFEQAWSLSSGQLQKVNLAYAFLVRTPLIFLDEPTVHLDPHAAHTVRYFVKEILNKELGQTIFMSTHYVQEAEFLCDRVGILNEGKLVALDTIKNLKKNLPANNLIEVDLDKGFSPNLSEKLKATGITKEVFEHIYDEVIGKAKLRVHLQRNADISDLIKVLHTSDATVRSIKPAEVSLEDVFFYLVQRKL